ncbi:MAG: hypothetical protein ABF379_06315 [Akkermansiaceae bacterium]
MNLCLAAAFAALIPLSSVAQEVTAAKKYILASKNPPTPVGSTHQVSDNLNFTNGKLKMKVGEQEFGGDMSNNTKEVQVIEYLADDKIKVTYLKNRKFEKSKIMGQEKEEEEIDPIEGRVVLLEKAEGKWGGKLQGDPVEPVDHEKVNDEIESLVKSLNNNTEESVEIYGTEPRKIGDSWKVDPKNVPGMDDFKIEKGTMSVTFLEVKELNGEPCAILKGTFSIDGLLTEEEMEGMSAKVSGEMRIVRSMKYFMDYKMEGDMEMSVKGVMKPQPGVLVDFGMTADLKGKKTTTVVPPKKGAE